VISYNYSLPTLSLLTGPIRYIISHPSILPKLTLLASLPKYEESLEGTLNVRHCMDLSLGLQ
jgi:hypothetical protein